MIVYIMSLLTTAYDYAEFSAEADRQVAEREREWAESRKRQEEKERRELADAREKYGDYWEGPYGVLVPVEEYSCTAADGANILYRDGGMTLLGVSRKPTREEWLAEHAELREDGKYYCIPRIMYLQRHAKIAVHVQ